jgi:hypothetical protein
MEQVYTEEEQLVFASLRLLALTYAMPAVYGAFSY